ncbi:hypothetical protein MKX08_009577 [Trichoderma sp. CBMAI-0020]|nr:hypothetical protein MKX08_009577 [Trichoderma sp. CBMAI-0020]
MPKPGLIALTGGYRKTPVMQIGADIYCDSRLIAEELEKRYPFPSLFPGNSKGLCLALSGWSDENFHTASSGLIIAVLKSKFPPDLMADREKFFKGFMDVRNLEHKIPHLKVQLRAYASLVEEQLSDGRPFWLGLEPSLADFHAYVELWAARMHLPFAQDLLKSFHKMSEWEKRVKAIGHGNRQEASIAEAHDLAQRSMPLPGAGIDPDDTLGLIDGDAVTVTPADYGKEPVTGRLVTLTVREVAVARDDPIAGQVVIHFPRIGYCISRSVSSEIRK